MARQREPGFGRRQLPDQQTEPLFEDELRRGRYLSVLESYLRDKPWTEERVARDVWQNFYDAEGFTTDGVAFERATTDDGRHEVAIRGRAEYPYARLLSFGGGLKEDVDRAAGGKHEGSRIAALHLLRDYGCNAVVYRSGDWELTFTLASPPEGSVDPVAAAGQRGLYAKLRTLPERVAGNEVRIITAKGEIADALISARDLFYRTDHPDFQHPDVDTADAGFRLLGEGKAGNFYLNGQRVHFDQRDRWGTLPQFTMWSKRTPRVGDRTLVLGRDRDLVTSGDLQETFLPFLVASMDQFDRTAVLAFLEPFYDTHDTGYDRRIGQALVRELICALRRDCVTLEFPSKYLADDLPLEQSRMFRELRYTLCPREFADIGMVRASDVLADTRELHAVEPSPEERQRMDFLMDTIREFASATGGQATDTQSIAQRLGVEARALPRRPAFAAIESKDIALFAGDHPYLAGRYDEDVVWMSRALLHTPHPDRAVATYLHELCHRHGPDESAEFSYALTEVLERWIAYLREHPDVLPTLDRAWESVRQPEWRTFEDFRKGIAALIPKQKAREFVASINPQSDAYAFQAYIERNVHQPLRTIIAREFGGRYNLATFRQLHEDIQQHEAMRAQHAELAKPWPDARTKDEARQLREQLELLTRRRSELDRDIEHEEDEIRRRYGSRERQKRKLRNNETITAFRQEQERVRREIRQHERDFADLMRPFYDETTDEQRYRSLRYASFRGASVDLGVLGDSGFTVATLALFRDVAPEQRVAVSIEELGAVLRYLRDRVRNPRRVQEVVRSELMWLFPIIEREPTDEHLRYARTLYEFLRE